MARTVTGVARLYVADARPGPGAPDVFGAAGRGATYLVGVGIRSPRPTVSPFAVQGFIAWTFASDTPK